MVQVPCLLSTISIRLLRSRPSAVALDAIGSASARPSTESRDLSPIVVAMMALAAWARAAESWKFDGKAMVRMGWSSV